MEISQRRVPACKRIFDILFSTTVLLLLFPLILAIALIILCMEGWPVVFTQERPGMGGKSFCMYKFRSMREKRDSNGKLLPDEERMTGLGKFLRRTSLDELPEFFNVFKGEMSVVGPRPLLTQYLERYTPEQARRHSVLPGVTGWAQVNGRNALTWEDKFRLDVWYVENWSFGLDLRIILMTICKVFQGEGISQSGHASMPEFMGSQEEEQKK